MSLAERTYICKTLLKKPGTKTSALQFELANRFGTTWDLSTIASTARPWASIRRFPARTTASDPVARNQYKLLWQARGLQPWQCVFMDETVRDINRTVLLRLN